MIRPALAVVLAAVLVAPPAQAGWTRRVVRSTEGGVDWVKAVVVASGRTTNSLGSVFVVVDVTDTATGVDTLEVRELDAADAMSPLRVITDALTQPGPLVYYLPAIAYDEVGERLHVLADTGATDPAQLTSWVIRPGTSIWPTATRHAPTVGGSGLVASSARRSAIAVSDVWDRIHACWTVPEAVPGTTEDDAWCDVRARTTGTPDWASLPAAFELGGGAGIQDHPDVAVHTGDGGVAAVWHDTTRPTTVPVRLFAASGAVHGTVEKGTARSDFPDLHERDGVFHLSWVDYTVVPARLGYTSCAVGTLGCADPAAWSPTSRPSQAGEAAGPAYLAVDAVGNVFLAYEQRATSTAATRVRLAYHCAAAAPGTWARTWVGTPTPNGAEELGYSFAQPGSVITVDDDRGLLHVGYVREDMAYADTIVGPSGDLFTPEQGVLATRPIAELCP